MKWTNEKTVEKDEQAALETLVSKTVLDDLLAQINGGSTLDACHPCDY